MLDLTFQSTGEIATIVARKDVEVIFPAHGDVPEREIDADAMDGTGAPGGGLSKARFIGGVQFLEAARGKAPRTAKSRTLDVGLEPGSGEIEQATFAGGTEFRDGALRTSSADAKYQITRGVLELSGSQGRNDPRVEDDRLTVDARRIDVTLQGTKMNAQENVRSVIQPESKRSPGATRAVPGLLKDDQPAYVTARSLVYDGERSLATYTGDARLWQADTSIQAASIAIDEQSGNLTARESVRSAFVLEERNEATKEVTRTPSTATAKEMHFENAERRATYQTDAHMVGPQGDVHGDRIVLYFLEGGGSLDRAEAYTNVRVKAEKRSATGDRLTYFANDARYLLTGAPVRTIEECRETTCKSLTFWRSTDRIACDGHEENRTLTKNAGSCTESRTK
jgi:lipopolysaccharide export system protein LptA